MYTSSVASIQPLVRWLALRCYRQRRLSAAQLWWLWLITILIHLLLVSGAMLSPPGAPAEGPGDDSAWRLPPGSWPIELVLLLLVLQPDEAPPFPWLRFRVRRVVRRRRLADMTLEELLAFATRGADHCPVGRLADPQPDGQAAGGHPHPLSHLGRAGRGGHH